MERPDYNGVKFFDANDWTISGNHRLAIEKLDNTRDLHTLSDINEIIELYEIYLIATCKGFQDEHSQSYIEKAKSLIPIVARFFKSIKDDNFEEYYWSVCFYYIDVFWDLFEKFSCYEAVSRKTMKRFFTEEEVVLGQILQHSKITEAYDQELADVLRKSDQTARLIVSEYLEEHSYNHKKLFFPKSMSAREFEGILQKYTDSEHPNAGVLQLIWQSQSSSECPISDQLRLNAKRRAQEVLAELPGVTMSFGVGVCFAPTEKLIEVEANDNHEILYKYNVRYLEERLDYLSIIECFSTLFAFMDSCGRSRFPSVSSKLGIFEGALGIKGAKEYKMGSVFRIETLRSSVITKAYYSFLKERGIELESIISWFFSDYLQEKYGIADYRFNASSDTSSFAEKCKNICSEMEGVLKQYKMYVDTGVIDRELFEIASSQISIGSLPSQIPEKYAYLYSKELQQELFLLFSDQSLLSCVPGHKEYRCFAELAESETIKIEEYNQLVKINLDFLIARQAISVDSSGIIVSNKKRIMLLKDLYDNEVLCLRYCNDFHDEIEEMLLNKDIEIESRLFTRPESDYLNYVLNKSTYSNGLDLRNRYAHGTYSENENAQEQDYIYLLKIMMMILLKIKEEFEMK